MPFSPRKVSTPPRMIEETITSTHSLNLEVSPATTLDLKAQAGMHVIILKPILPSPSWMN